MHHCYSVSVELRKLYQLAPAHSAARGMVDTAEAQRDDISLGLLWAVSLRNNQHVFHFCLLDVQCGLATCVITNNVNATSADVIEGNATGTYIIDCTSVMGTGDSNSWSFDGVNISTEDINQVHVCMTYNLDPLATSSHFFHFCLYVLVMAQVL